MRTELFRRRAPSRAPAPAHPKNGQPGAIRSAEAARHPRARQVRDAGRVAEAIPGDAIALPPRRPPGYFRFRLALADAAAVLSGGATAFLVWLLVVEPGRTTLSQHLLLYVATFPLWLGVIVARKLLVARAVVQPAEELQRIWTASALATILTVATAFVLGYQNLSRGWIATLFVATGLALCAERWIARRMFYRLRKSGRLVRRIVIIGSDTNAIRTMHTLQHDPGLGYDVVGYVGDEDVGVRAGCPYLGPIDRVGLVLRDHDCTGAIVSLPSVESAAVNWLARDLTEKGFHVALSTSLNDIDINRLRPQSIDRRTMLYVEPIIRDGWRAHAKRGFDIAVSGIALLLASPILLAAAGAIWLETRGSVLFRQDRVGKDGRHFSMVKLRTMHHDAEQRLEELLAANESDGALFKIADDPRITRVGRILRKWSIDEIPQFFNVLRGDMSIVGPRPALPREVSQWDRETAERLRVLPGITGLWQVEGRASTDFATYKRLDLYYVDNWSLAHDLVIVLKTFRAVLTARGAA